MKTIRTKHGDLIRVTDEVAHRSVKSGDAVYVPKHILKEKYVPRYKRG